MSLAKKTFIAAIWSTFASVGSRLVGVITTFFLTQFLPPAVQGEVNVAVVIVTSASMIGLIGVSQFVVAKPKSSTQTMWHVTVIHIGVGGVLFLACHLLRHKLAAWMGSPDVALYIPGLVVSQAIERIALLPRNLLVSDMMFKTIGFRTVVCEIVYGVVTLGAAWAGWGGQSIIIGNLARAVIGFIILARAAGFARWTTPAKLDGQVTRELMDFGVPFTIGAVFHFGASNWDNLVIQKRFGETTLGLYNLAYRLADLPATHIGEQLGDVLVPSFAKLDDQDARRAALRRSAALMGLVVFPMAIGLGAIADSLVKAFFKPEWWGAASLLTILSILSVVRPIGWLIGSYFMVATRTRTIMWLEILKVVSILGSMYALAPLGPLWTCAGVGIGFGLNAFMYLWSMRSEGVGFRDLVWPFVPPLAACLPMALAVYGVRAALPDTPMKLRLLIEIVVGGVVYIPSALLVARAASRDLLSLVRRVVLKRD